jgi:hypothetical protein
MLQPNQRRLGTSGLQAALGRGPIRYTFALESIVIEPTTANSLTQKKKW